MQRGEVEVIAMDATILPPETDNVKAEPHSNVVFAVVVAVVNSSVARKASRSDEQGARSKAN